MGVVLDYSLFDLKDEAVIARLARTDTDLIKNMFAENPRYSVREIMDAPNIARTTLDNHLTKIGMGMLSNDFAEKKKKKLMGHPSRYMSPN